MIISDKVIGSWGAGTINKRPRWEDNLVGLLWLLLLLV